MPTKATLIMKKASNPAKVTTTLLVIMIIMTLRLVWRTIRLSQD